MSDHRPSPDVEPLPDARVIVLTTLWNRRIVDRLLDGVRGRLGELQIDFEVHDVPGAYELPTAATWATQKADAVIGLGCVIRGATPHFEYVAGNCSRGLMEVSLATQVPVIFGVLTVETEDQALDRSGGEHGHVGIEAADAAASMIRLRRKLTS
ncbi:MAG: 6,7-dimethyl-8-ribityllumazine synthase [Planctomycetota bacterium]